MANGTYSIKKAWELWLDPSPFEVADLDDGEDGYDAYGQVGLHAFQLS
jgi:hypothetical protein